MRRFLVFVCVLGLSSACTAGQPALAPSTTAGASSVTPSSRTTPNTTSQPIPSTTQSQPDGSTTTTQSPIPLGTPCTEDCESEPIWFDHPTWGASTVSVVKETEEDEENLFARLRIEIRSPEGDVLWASEPLFAGGPITPLGPRDAQGRLTADKTGTLWFLDEGGVFVRYRNIVAFQPTPGGVWEVAAEVVFEGLPEDRDGDGFFEITTADKLGTDLFAEAGGVWVLLAEEWNGTEFSGVASESLELVRSDTGWQIDDCPDGSASCRTVVWFEPFTDTEVDSEVCSPEGDDPVLLCFKGVIGGSGAEDSITRYFEVHGLDGSQPPFVIEVAGP